MRRIFVSGIGTGVGKTVVAAILCEALNADYWKPVQCGNLEDSDTDTIKNLITDGHKRIHPESYRFKTPMSPHAAAALEGTKIDLKAIKPPSTNNTLVIEGAGGLLVPLNEKHLIIDLIKELDAEVVLVSRNYLGSINHTLLSVEALLRRDIKLSGIVFNGPPAPSSQEYILSYTNVRFLGFVDEEKELNNQVIKNYGSSLALGLVR